MKMKKSSLLLAMASFLVVGMTSCEKGEEMEEAITQNLEVKLMMNEDYTFTLPENLRDDKYEIVSPATHASISLVGLDAQGNQIYQYTPEENYSGTDLVVLSNDQVREEQCNRPPHPRKGLHLRKKPGNCEEKEEHYIITINFQIEAPELLKAVK
jgi:hypothetical protein